MVSHSTWNVIFQKSISCFQSTYANICVWPHHYSLTNLLLLGFNLKHCFHFAWKIKNKKTQKRNISKFLHLSLEPKMSQFFHRLLLLPRRVLCCSLTKPCPTLCDPMGCSISGFLVLHYLLEFALTHVYCVRDAISSSHPLLYPSPPAFNLSQDQGLFQWVTSLHHVAKGLKLQLQDQFFQRIFRVDFQEDWLVWSAQAKVLTRVFSSTTIWKHPFSALSLLYGSLLTSIHD